ncbi:MAG: tetratricopeptide repeat protein [bacterium]|nr:tetratricopeptide repeat protein [bacterium]
MWLFLASFLMLRVVKAPTDSFEVIEKLFMREQYKEALAGYKVLVKYEDTAEEALYRIGECYYNLRDYREAIKTFEYLLNTYKKSYLAPEAIWGVGLCWLVLGDTKMARKYLIDEIDKFPGYVDEKRTLCGKGITLYADGKYKDALVYLEQLHTKEGLYYRAKCYAAMGDPLRAIETYKEAIDRYPGTKLAEYSAFCMGDALFDNKDYPGAAKKYEDFMRKFAWSELKEYARYKMGCCYYDAGNYEKSIQMFQYSIKSEDQWLAAHSYYQLGMARKKLKRIEDAITCFQTTKADYPTMRVAALAHVRYGQCFIDRGDTTGAQLSFQQVISAYPTGNFAGLGDFLTASAFFIEKRYTEAIERYQRVLNLFPKSEVILPSYAMMLYSYLQLGKYVEGASIGTSQLKLIPPDSGELWVGRSKLFLGELYYYLDRYPKAKEFYGEVMDEFLDPEVKAPAFLGNAYCILEQGETKTAHDMMKDAYQRWGEWDTTLAISALYGWGIASFNGGDFEDAYNTFLFGVGDMYPEKIPAIAGNAYYHGGKALSATGKYANAIEYWKKVLDEYPTCPRAPDAAFDLGRTYYMAGKFSDAEDNYTLILEKYTKSSKAKEAQFQLGAAYYAAKEYEDAIREYNKFINLYPEDTLANQAKTQIQTALYISGTEDPDKWKELINKYPTSDLAAEAQYMIAADVYNKEEYEQAIVEFQKLVVNFPKSPHAVESQYYIIGIYGTLKQYDKKIEEINRFLRYFPNDKKVPDIYFQLGATYFNLKKYMDALKPFQTVIDKYPDYDKRNDAGYYLGVCYDALGEPATANRLKEKFKKSDKSGAADTTATTTKK